MSHINVGQLEHWSITVLDGVPSVCSTPSGLQVLV